MRFEYRRIAQAAACALTLGAAVALGQGSTVDEIAKYRAALQDGNPAELWEARGEDLWKQKRGPKNASLEACDLGLGPGVVKGAYAQLPRYFADADRVMDLESRIVWCMVTLQGYTDADAKKGVFGSPDRKSDMEAYVAYVTSQSRGVKMNVALVAPEGAGGVPARARRCSISAAARTTSRARRATARTPSASGCRTCPTSPGAEGAQKAYTTWPAYRVSQGELRTFQWRLNDCFRQQRFPELVFGSDASIALTMFLARNANGAAFDAPAIKR